MAKRRSKYEASIPPISQTLSIAPSPAFHTYTDDYKFLPLATDSGFVSESAHYGPELHLQIPPSIASFNNGIFENDNLPYGNMEWEFRRYG